MRILKPLQLESWFGRAAIGALMIGMTLLGCTRPEDSSFAAQAVRRGDNCNAIAAGSAMDAYGHSAGPAEEIYENVKRDCLDWKKREAARTHANAPR
jgi:hypothetical protein